MTPPGQPLEERKGAVRFKENAIVGFLFNFASNRGMGMNEIWALPFAEEDRKQFAQLIGYSVVGYCELPYVRESDRKKAIRLLRRFEKDSKDSKCS